MPSLNTLISLLFLALTTPTTLALPVSLPAAQNTEPPATAAAPPRLVAYIQTFKTPSGGPLSLLPLLHESTGVTHILLSAVHINSQPGQIHINDHPPSDARYDTLWSEVRELQAGGIKVMMMLGGAAGGTYQRLSGDEAEFRAYYDPLLALLKDRNIDGLDLDIEESVPIDTPLRLLRRLHADMGKDFLLTMAPVASAMLRNGIGLHGFPQKDMDDQALEPSRPNGKLVNWYNAQFYNGWGDASSGEMYGEILEQGGWETERVVMGVLTNPGDGGSGFVGLETLKGVVGGLVARYERFGCAVGWEYWAAGTGDGLAEPWMWVKALGDVIHGGGKAGAQQDASSAASNSTSTEPKESGEGSAAPSSPRRDPPTPWPSQMEKLESVGAGHWESVRALNMTSGDLKPASDLLGVADLINELVGGALDQVDGVLSSLSLA